MNLLVFIIRYLKYAPYLSNRLSPLKYKRNRYILIVYL